MAKFETRSRLTIASILAIATPIPLIGLLMGTQVKEVYAESIAPIEQTFSIPKSLPKGASLTISGEPSTHGISNNLTTQFQQNFADTKIKIKSQTSQTALESLQAGNVDLAMIGRPLTQDEQNRGLVSVPVSRHKIGIFTGKNNSFQGNLTNDQFAKIMSGDIQNWSELGGADQPIRILTPGPGTDLLTSLTRYPVFEGKDLVKGEPVSHDIEQLVAQLGDDGIAYAPAAKIMEREDVQIIPMHNVFPDDSRYSFSQPISYIYQGLDPNPTVQAFLGFTQVPEQAAAIELGRLQSLDQTSSEQTASDESALPSTEANPPVDTSSSTGIASANNTESNANNNWWWLLLPLGGAAIGAAWWGLKGKSGSGTSMVKHSVPAMTTDLNHSNHSRLIMVEKDSQHAYAFWELNQTDRQFLDENPDVDLKLRIHDVTADSQASSGFQELDCDHNESDCNVPIATSNRRYIAQLGHNTSTEGWTKFATSSPLHISAPSPSPAGPSPNQTELNETLINHQSVAVAPAIANSASLAHQTDLNESPSEQSDQENSNDNLATLPFTQGVSSLRSSWINLIPHSSCKGEVTWHLSDADVKQVTAVNQNDLVVRIHDVAATQSGDSNSTQNPEFQTNLQAQAMMVDLPAGDRNYVAELGYYTPVNRWVSLIHSSQSHLPTAEQDGARVMIMPCDPYHLSLSPEKLSNGPKAYIYWDISDDRKAATRAQGGNILVVRVYGHVDGNHTNPDNYRQISENIIQEEDRDRVIAVPDGDRNYRAEVGHLTIQGQFLSLGKSAPILIPRLSSREV